VKNGWPFARRLLVLDSETNDRVYETIYYESEGTSLNPLNYQWTGKLFKNKPAVIFGFQIHSFDCPTIQFLSMSEKEISLYCDNNH